MSLSTKHIIFNRYNLIAFLTTSLGCFLSWAVADDFFKVLFGPSLPHLTKGEYLYLVFNFSSYAIFGFSLLQLVIPLIAAIPVIPFIREKKYNAVLLHTHTKLPCLDIKADVQAATDRLPYTVCGIYAFPLRWSGVEYRSVSDAAHKHDHRRGALCA